MTRVGNKEKVNITISPYLEDHDEESRRMTPRAPGVMYQRLSTKAGKDTGTFEFNTIRSHNMRKLFNSTLKNAGCDSDLVEYFMGHSLGGTKEAYYRPDIDKLKEIYIKFVPHLIVSEEFELNEELKQQSAVNDDLKKVIDDLSRSRDDIAQRLMLIELAMKGKEG